MPNRMLDRLESPPAPFIKTRVAQWRLLVAVVGVIGVIGSAHAADTNEHFNNYEFTPFVGFVAGGEFEDPVDSTGRDIDEGNNFGLIFDIAADEWRHYEFLYARQSSEIDADIAGGAEPLDLDVEYLHLGGTVSWPEAQRVIPYFGLTVGFTRFSPDLDGLDDETKLSFGISTGLKIPITDHFGVRLDVRGFATLLDTDGDLFCVSSNGTGTCRIRAKSDTLLQYTASLGVTIGF
jgi:opacity protein-like surface antigen